MSKINSKKKGNSFELWVAHQLKEVFPNVKRHLEFQIQDCKGYDLDNTGKLKIQCKAYKDYAPISKINEVKEAGIPCLVTKGNRKEPMIVLPLKEFIRIISDIGYLYEDDSNDKRCKIPRSIEDKDNSTRVQDLRSKRIAIPGLPKT